MLIDELLLLRNERDALASRENAIHDKINELIAKSNLPKGRSVVCLNGVPACMLERHIEGVTGGNGGIVFADSVRLPKLIPAPDISELLARDKEREEARRAYHAACTAVDNAARRLADSLNIPEEEDDDPVEYVLMDGDNAVLMLSRAEKVYYSNPPNIVHADDVSLSPEIKIYCGD